MATYKWMPVLIAAVAFHAPSAQAEDLLTLYQKALTQDSRLAIGESEYRAALEAKPGARASLLPQLSASGRYEHHDQTYDDIPAARANLYKDGSYSSRNLSLTLDQTIYDRSQWKAYAQADDVVFQAEAEKKASEQDLIMRLATAYFETLAAADNLKFTQMEKQATAHQADEMKRRFEAGLTTQVDVKESAAQLSLASAQEIDATYQLSVEKENLSVITGETPTRLRNLKANLQLQPLKGSMEDWTKISLGNSPQVRSALAALHHAEKEVERRRSHYLPTVGLTAEYSNNDDDGGFSEGKDTDTSIGVELNMPIFSGGKTRSEVREAKALLVKAKKQYQLAKRETLRETRAAYLNAKASINRMTALQQALVATDAAYAASRTGLQIGTRTVLEVLSGLRESLRAKKDYKRARYDYVLSLLRLKQAAGELSGTDIEKVNAWLQDF